MIEKKEYLDELAADFSNQQSRVEMMHYFGGIDTMLVGNNADGELTRLSIYPDKLVVVTHQSNGWVRVDEYGEFGDLASTTYDGRWE